LKRHSKQYEKFSDHIGFIPLVIISPADRDLIVEGSETRRKFLDSVISQIDLNYLQQLIQYQKILSQRNALLKYFAINHVFETATLSIYNEQMSHLGQSIFEKRKRFIETFVLIFNEHHQAISGAQETVQLVYESHLEDKNLLQLLEENISKDRALQYTSVGIHRDDLLFEIDHFPIKKFGSQGQQKSFLIALKLAQFEFVKKQSNENPISLFDDILDKLDESRVEKIIEMVNKDTFGQLFISDTHRERTEKIVKSTHQSYKIFSL
jgi:DNA replication and repair protein RecF